MPVPHPGVDSSGACAPSAGLSRNEGVRCRGVALYLNRRLPCYFRGRSKNRGCLRFKCNSVHELKPVDRLPVHELSAVNGHSLRFKYRATTDIQALVLGVREECFCCKMAAGNTTVGSTP